jgi:RHS repeat-associated protein
MLIIIVLCEVNSFATTVKVQNGSLLVNEEPFIIKGVTYSPVPIGVDPETTPPYGDYFTSRYRAIYERDLSLLRQMGANTIRLLRWDNTADHTDFLTKAYNHGSQPIYVIITFPIDPTVYPDIDTPSAREKIKSDFRAMVAAYKNYPAVLMWSIGNGLNAPTMYGDRLDQVMSLINELAREAHAAEGDNYHPVTTPLADIDIIDTIATYEPVMTDLDVWGVNSSGGDSFGALFKDFQDVSGKPLIIMEFGIDAYNDAAGDEYENIGIPYQATYAASLWKEIVVNGDICIGGVIKAYSDEWWLGKYGNTLPECPDPDPAFHSVCGSPTDSHPDKFVNNEWFGLMRVREDDAQIDRMEPRRVYMTLRSLWAPKELIVSSETQMEQTSPSIEKNTPAYYASLFQAAEEAWNAHRWNEALEQYRAITTATSPHAKAYLSKAHIRIGRYYKYFGRWSEAIEEFEEAIEQAEVVRDIEDAQTSIAAVYISKGEYHQALSILRQVIANTHDWQQVKYSTYWLKELKRRMAFGSKSACNTCGPDALKTLLQFTGITSSEGELAGALPQKPAGASMADLTHLAAAKGLHLKGVKLSLDQLKAVAKPLLVLLDDPKHYVIVTGIDAGGIHILDPQYSREPYHMPAKVFQKRWKGYALVSGELEPGMAKARLADDAMQNLRGRVCYCCPESNNGTQIPNTFFERNSCSIGGGTSPGMPSLLVNTTNLNIVVQDTDLIYSGRGPRIAIIRSYNADDSRDGPFGHSWTFNYNVTVTENPNGSVDIRRETGTIHRFADAGNGNYNPPQGIYDTLVKKANGTYSLQLKGSKLTQNFNAAGRLTSIADRNGNAITFHYDADGRLTTITDAVGRETALHYGSNGKIDSIVDPLGRTILYSYDDNNNLVSTTDMAGNTVYYTYDDNSYMTSITTSKGTTTLTYYSNSDGYALKSLTDPLGNTKFYGTFDSHYNIRVVDANGNPRYYKNNGDGYIEQITDALGNSVTYGYDSHGNLTSIRDPRENTTSLTYDSRGNITSITDPLGHSVQLTYDGDDNLTSLTDPAGNASLAEYDAHGNLTKITDPEGGVITFTYNAYGEPLTLSGPRDSTFRFAYDTQGNIITMTNPVGGQDAYTYDEVGRVLSHTAPIGNTKSFTYDGIDRMVEVRYPDGSVKTYTYDCCGVATVTDPTGTLSFIYDGANRLVRFTDVYGQTITYDYDKVGNLTVLTYPDGKTVRYTYDRANRLIQVTDWLDNVTTYAYDPTGNLIKTTQPDGSIVTYTYDDANRLSSILDYRSDGAVIGSFHYTLDSLGNRTETSFYQPLIPSLQAQNTTYVYDADNRLLSAGEESFYYDDNGNLTQKTMDHDEATYTWDADNMLTQVVSDERIFRYAYDGRRNRIARTEQSVETRYVVDPISFLYRPLAETDASGNVTAYYVYGLGLIAKTTPDDQTYYYHYDGTGSTIAVTDSSGNIVNKYAYDAFGKVLDSEEMLPNPFKYVGRFGVMDEGNGLLYMWARYYDPETGRFISKDPIGFFGGMNMYAYVGNNPVNWVDPSGLFYHYLVVFCLSHPIETYEVISGISTTILAYILGYSDFQWYDSSALNNLSSFITGKMITLTTNIKKAMKRFAKNLSNKIIKLFQDLNDPGYVTHLLHYIR